MNGLLSGTGNHLSLGTESDLKLVSWRKRNWTLYLENADKTCDLFSGMFNPLTLSKTHFNDCGDCFLGSSA